MYKLVFILTLSFFGLFGQTPTADCFSSTFRICDTTTLFLFNKIPSSNQYGSVLDIPPGNTVSNPTVNPASSNSGCLLMGEVYPTWAIIEVFAGGTFGFYFGVSGGQLGFNDWIIWPYDTSSCSKIKNNLLAPVRCNYNGASSGGTGMGPVPAGGYSQNFEPMMSVNTGDKFILCLIDYSNIGLSTMNFSKLGTAQLGCGISTGDLKSIEKRELKIYPNPVSGSIKLRLNEPALIMIYDANGKLLRESAISLGQNEIMVDGFNDGIYLCSVLTESGIRYASKFVIRN